MLRSRLAYVALAAAVLAPIGARATTTSCNIPQPCAVFANNSGVALQGESAGADGVLGEAASGTIYGAGIEGESLKQTGADAAGTFGLTLLSSGVAPNYGVVAYGSLYGVYGQAGSTGLSSTGPAYGVFGQDNAGSNKEDYNVGVTGLSKNNVGVLAEANGAPSLIYGRFGIPIGLYAVGKNNNNASGQAYGIYAESDVYGAEIYNTTAPDSLLIAEPGYFLNDGFDLSVDYSGNERLGGSLTTSKGGPYVRTTGASGTTVTAYSEHTTIPEIEDAGSGQLVGGRAFVPIDAALADVIDPRAGYRVFVTPEGDSKGLYVVNGAGGFFVHEQQGGHSTIPFDYRIIAKPREEQGARLARVTDVAPAVEPSERLGRKSARPIPLPLSPEERLKRGMGTPAHAEVMTTSCNVPQPCAVFANNSGAALQGESTDADGVLGEAASGTIYGAGIEGESLKQTGADAAGTFGLTLLSSGVAPNYGVVAYGSLYGVYGQAGNTGLSSTGPGYGVFGQDNAGSNKKDYNVGVTGLSKNNVGVLAEANGAPTAAADQFGTYGVPVGLYAVAENNNNAYGQAYAIYAESDVTGATFYNTAAGERLDIATTTDYLNGGANFYVDSSGNEKLGGTLTTKGKGGPYVRTTGASGTTVTAYSEHTTLPEIEDAGGGQLVGGRAFVPIDAALADVIDPRAGYRVFVTPEGENKGLYVLKGAGGFFVREQQGGRSTIPFDYRIIAKPREERGARLARVTDVAPDVEPFHRLGRKSARPIPLPLSPEERLKREIGTHAYAKLMIALGKRFATVRSR